MLDIITTWLEITGLVLLAGGAAAQVWVWSVPGALATGGALLIAEAAFVGWRARPKAKAVGDETA